MKPAAILFSLSLTLLISLSANSQSDSAGVISYITTQSVYVKFGSTQAIQPGDTLYAEFNGQRTPALVVTGKSSISCVCNPLEGFTPTLSQSIYFKRGTRQGIKPDQPAPANFASGVKETGEIKPDSTEKSPSAANLEDKSTRISSKTNRQQIHGNLAVAAYTNFSNTDAGNSLKMKYTFSFLGKNLGNTNLSAECYINYIRNDNQWNEIPNTIFNSLKIYSLALRYDFGSKASLLLGRKINPYLSNMGANDGLQFNARFGDFGLGVIAGFRPDFQDYGFDAGLFQAGIYAAHELQGKHGRMQSTLAFVEQTNDWKTDRRYLYLQHVNSLVKGLSFYGTAELDLYKMNFNQADSSYTSASTLQLTNLYLSLSYRILRQLTVAFSYSSRQPVIYYETYRNYLDKLLDPENLQGYLLQVTYRPVNRLSIGVTGGYRFMKADNRPTKNLHGYVSYNDIPGIRSTATVSVTLLETAYLGGNIYSIGLSKDLVKGRFSGSITYRYIDYRFSYAGNDLIQNVAEASLNWRILKKLGLSVYYEGTFEPENLFNRLYGQVQFTF